MSDALENPPSFGGNPGEPVAEVDPDDLKALWQEISNLQARDPGQHVSIGFEAKAIAKPGVNAEAVWYRSMMFGCSTNSRPSSWLLGSRMKRFRMLSSERWRRFRWNGSDPLSGKACPSMLKSSSAD
jgi:hypothetical protein